VVIYVLVISKDEKSCVGVYGMMSMFYLKVVKVTEQCTLQTYKVLFFF